MQFSKWSVLAFACAMAASVSAREIKLAAATFDPMVVVPTIKGPLRSQEATNTLWIAQFSARISDQDCATSNARGLTVLDYLPEDALLIRGEKSEIENLPGIRWVGAYEPAYKLSPELFTRNFKSTERLQLKAAGIARCYVYFTRDTEPLLLANQLQSIGAVVKATDVFGGQPVATIEANRDQLENLATWPSIQFIENAPERTYRNNTVRWLMQSTTANATPVYNNGLTGTGQIVGVLDDNLNVSHTSFVDSIAVGPAHRKVISKVSSAAQITHGTHVCGIVAGDAGVFDDRRGTAYGAKIAFTEDEPATTSGTVTTLYSKFVAHQNLGARVHTNSWGDDDTEAYTGWSRAIDLFSYDYEDSAVLFAITNLLGVMKVPENAKSCIGVGATLDSPSQNSMAVTFSGTGPTADGRRKPDVCAPGASILSSSASNVNGTQSLSGTSMATPAVAAAMILARQYFVEGREVDGSPTPTWSRIPSGALMRATIVASGQDQTGDTGYPGTREGWGRVTLDRVLSFPGDTRKLGVFDLRRANGLSSGQTLTGRFQVLTNTNPLRLSMAFTDFPGAVGVASAPVNNVSITATTPGGSVYRGNVFTSGQSATGGSEDLINSIEQIHRTSPVLGVWTVNVSAPTVASGGTQGFGLVATGNLQFGSMTGNLTSIPAGIPLGNSATTTLTTLQNGEARSLSTALNTSTGAFTHDPKRLVLGGFTLTYKVPGFLRRTTTTLTNTFSAVGTTQLYAGDIDNSGEIGPGDLQAVLDTFGGSGAADVDKDGEVGPGDLQIVLDHFGLEDN